MSIIKLSPATSLRRLGVEHPLADVASRHCRLHIGGPDALIGGVACGPCWELAIRDDERFIVEAGLPREIEPDPDYVDDIAVELACRGQRVPLTRVDFAAAVGILRRRGLSVPQIATRLHATNHRVTTAIARSSVVGLASAA